MRESSGQFMLFGLVALSFLTAFLFAVFPLPRDYSLLRPEVVCLLVLYWVMFNPEQIGVTLAFVVGVLQDVVEGVVWGAHAVALAVLAYICLVSYQRIRNYSVWHQALWVFVLVGTHQVLVNWIQGLAGYQVPVAHMLIPTMVSALCWPALCYGMNRLRRQYRII